MEFNYDTMCFACGEQNDWGLKLKFTEKDGVVETSIVPSEVFQGYPGVMHGGLNATILDEVMARAVYAAGFNAMTARMELRYRKHVPIGQKVTYRARIVKAREKLYELESEAILEDGSVAVEASARFMIINEEELNGTE